MTKFQVLHNIFHMYADEVFVEMDYEKFGIAGMLDDYNDMHGYKPFAVDECVNSFIDDVDEAYVFENTYYMVIGATLIRVFASEYGTHFEMKKEAYIPIYRVSLFAKRIK